ncbi:serine protease nudel [Caerostris extrusa]|uniref:Serine protease nudel n=1 Tax=Caerostris extrusa TaxID=172846 RepID=A0AAV4N051_CAEEX|nr:serine protease nudel [Caerostris extrusa]
MVENVFLSSSLEPAFIAARIYAFRPGLLVFFRIYLDRRKLQKDDSDTLKMVKSLVGSGSPAFGALTIDGESVDVDENEEWISLPGMEQRIAKQPTKGPPPRLATSTPNRRPPQTRDDRAETHEGTGEVVAVGAVNPEEDTLQKFSYGQWKPVPIEDKVSPSFGDQRTPPGRGNVRLSPEAPRPVPPPRRTPSPNVVVPSSSAPKKPSPPSRPSNPKVQSVGVGVGSVSVLEDPLSHVDPIPIPNRNGRPLLLQEPPPQKGEVASSIMSSVSLVVRPPSNRTSSSGRLDRKESPFRQPAALKDHPQASFRFLKEGVLGEGSVHVESDSTEENTSSESTTSDESYSEDKKITQSGNLKESSVEYLSSSEDSKIASTSQINLKESSVEYISTLDEKLTSLDKDLATSTRGANLNEFSEEYVGTLNNESPSDGLVDSVSSKSSNRKESSVESLTEDLSREELEKVPVTTSEVIHDKESSVEYVDNTVITEKSLTEIHTTHESNIASKAFEESKNQVGTVSTLENSENEMLISNFTTEFPTDLTSVNELTTVTSLNTANNNVELKKGNVLQIYSAKSDIGSINQNPSILSDEPTTTSSSNYEYNSLETNATNFEFSASSILYTKYMNTEKIITESLSDPVTESKNSSFTTDFTTLFRNDESLDESTNYVSDFSNAASTDYEVSNEDVSVPVDGESITSSEQPTISEDSNELQILTTKLIDMDDSKLDSIELHVQPGHGFHSPSQKESSPTENSSPIATSTVVLKPSTVTPTHSTSEEVQKVTVPEQTVEAHTTTTTSTEELSTSDSHLIESSSNDTSIGKIVPQQSDLNFDANDIESDDSIPGWTDDDPLDKSTEIIRHITTLPPTPVSLGKHPVFITHTCLEDEFQCDSGECVDAVSRCNMRRDCRDNSDEKNCSCSELLKVMGQSQKICDGVDDCEDRSDEQNCPWCSEGQVLCPQNKFCINQSLVCDGHPDCPSGLDEKHCVKLAENAADARGLHLRQQGFLMVRKGITWGKLCLDNVSDSHSLERKLDDLGKAVCSTLTFSGVAESVRARDLDDSSDTYYSISSEVSEDHRRSNTIFHPSSCESKQVMRVECGSLECGLRPMASVHRRRIVGGQSAGQGSWPWQVALYKEGDFQCGAVIISDTWLISAGHCFYSTQSAHWVARLGLLRRGSELSPPSEQIRRISHIVLHPRYEDKGFINDIALLRLDAPVLSEGSLYDDGRVIHVYRRSSLYLNVMFRRFNGQICQYSCVVRLCFSDYLRPVCLPTPEEDAGLWHGRQCSVVGWGKLYEIGHTFPDSLQEVRLPVISTEECRKKILFLTMYHITDNMFCAGFERGGRDACLGDSGGPLMCQRADGRWILLGVTSNGDGCGRPGRPGVYTKVANYLHWIRNVTVSKTIVQTPPDLCQGVRCKLGRCIESYKVCDGRWDCSEGKDEDHCMD